MKHYPSSEVVAAFLCQLYSLPRRDNIFSLRNTRTLEDPTRMIEE